MIRLLVYAIVGIALLFIVTEILKFLSAISGTRNQMLKDKNQFIKSFDRTELVAWPWKELNTISMNVDFGISKYDMITSAQEASFTTIYTEYLGHMMSKKYGEKELMLLLIREDSFEMFQNDNGEVTVQLNKEKAIPALFDDQKFSFKYNDSLFTLQENGSRGELLINEKSILLTNDGVSHSASMKRLVQVMPENVNIKNHKIVKFLLLFYLIWRQESN